VQKEDPHPQVPGMEGKGTSQDAHSLFSSLAVGRTEGLSWDHKAMRRGHNTFFVLPHHSGRGKMRAEVNLDAPTHNCQLWPYCCTEHTTHAPHTYTHIPRPKGLLSAPPIPVRKIFLTSALQKQTQAALGGNPFISPKAPRAKLKLCEGTSTKRS
jgi:hypothetical protein